jgi:hypothetical protein
VEIERCRPGINKNNAVGKLAWERVFKLLTDNPFQLTHAESSDDNVVSRLAIAFSQLSSGGVFMAGRKKSSIYYIKPTIGRRCKRDKVQLSVGINVSAWI